MGNEAAEHKELMQSDTTAKELILFAKNRLNKFYNPKLYKAPPKRQLSAGDQIYENEGGDIPTEAPGGIANTGISFVQVSDEAAPPPPPATVAAYSKKSGESNGIIAMMDLLVQDSKSVTNKEGAKADLEGSLETNRGEKKAGLKQLMAVDKVLSDLHGECDWLLKN